MFSIISLYDKVSKAKKEEVKKEIAEQRKCNYCISPIEENASRCPFCTSDLTETSSNNNNNSNNVIN
jgi:predicted Zn-ribbon and HTH transcriptional regulator